MESTADSSDILLQCALDLFGRHGFDGTSTRAIARAAGKPMSAITYHFGGKQELYIAVARHLSEQIAQQIAPAVAAATAAGDADSPADTRNRIRLVFATFMTILVRPESAAWARYIVREQMDPTPAFDELYKAPMGPMLAHVSAMLRRLSGDRLGAEEARVRAIAMFGQALVFRVARALVLRGNGWDDVGEAEAETIRAVVLSQVDAILDSLEAKDAA
jgi:AcrR family transcriptional regulator